MDDLEQIYKKYPGFKFWSSRRRPIVIYFLAYYAIFFAITKIDKETDVFFIFFLFWIGVIAFGVFTYFAFSRGMENYLHQYNEELRLFLFDDKIYVERAFPVIGTPGIMRFLFRTKDYQIDRVLKNLKHNILIFYICTVLVLVAGIILMQSYS